MSSFKNITGLARDLRRNQTLAEKLLWHELRNRKLDGHKFLRQHPIIYACFGRKTQFFIADFYCAAKLLIIELDGGIHALQKEHDQRRDEILSEKGLRVMRIENKELKDMKGVKEKIRGALYSPPTPLYE